jgi:hypothetical protein
VGGSDALHEIADLRRGLARLNVAGSAAMPETWKRRTG